MERADGNSGVSISRDLMNKKIKIEVEAHNLTNEEQKPNGKIQLNLGLSLNSPFSVGPSSAKTLERSRSVSNLPGKAAVHLPRRAARDEHSQELPRASSLPAVRKKRIEKMKSVRVVKAEIVGSGLHKGEKGGVDVKFPDNVGAVNGPGNLQSSEGSIGSQMGAGSTGYHFPQAPAMMGANLNNNMLRSSSTRQIQIPKNEHGVPRSAVAADSDRDDRQILKNAMLNMPHVSTKANGFKQIEGILYKYARPDELKIVCACHGFFFSPAEFVRHGGGRDVEHPLKQIFVNFCPLL
ncbi:hypothetical protein CASFOL_015167 [Castilleja foliolosa]|uniref:Ninja-family protein n=1 Tax=Castilleja foliolosa TaxID=1961234 RepID=A0ABD3DEC3_9LAMI